MVGLARNVLRGAYLGPFSLRPLFAFFREGVLIVLNFNTRFMEKL